MKGGEECGVVLVGFDLAHEFPADGGVVRKIADGPPKGKQLRRGYQASSVVNSGRQVAASKDSTGREAN